MRGFTPWGLGGTFQTSVCIPFADFVCRRKDNASAAVRNPSFGLLHQETDPCLLHTSVAVSCAFIIRWGHTSFLSRPLVCCLHRLRLVQVLDHVVTLRFAYWLNAGDVPILFPYIRDGFNVAGFKPAKQQVPLQFFFLVGDGSPLLERSWNRRSRTGQGAMLERLLLASCLNLHSLMPLQPCWRFR
jgi:hypothetical protein